MGIVQPNEVSKSNSEVFLDTLLVHEKPDLVRKINAGDISGKILMHGIGEDFLEKHFIEQIPDGILYVFMAKEAYKFQKAGRMIKGAPKSDGSSSDCGDWNWALRDISDTLHDKTTTLHFLFYSRESKREAQRLFSEKLQEFQLKEAVAIEITKEPLQRLVFYNLVAYPVLELF